MVQLLSNTSPSPAVSQQPPPIIEASFTTLALHESSLREPDELIEQIRASDGVMFRKYALKGWTVEYKGIIPPMPPLPVDTVHQWHFVCVWGGPIVGLFAGWEHARVALHSIPLKAQPFGFSIYTTWKIACERWARRCEFQRPTGRLSVRSALTIDRIPTLTAWALEHIVREVLKAEDDLLWAGFPDFADVTEDEWKAIGL